MASRGPLAMFVGAVGVDALALYQIVPQQRIALFPKENVSKREESLFQIFKYQSHYVNRYLGLFIHVKNGTDRFTFVHQFERFVHVL